MPGGGWALEEPRPLLTGAALEAEGGDRARWAKWPINEDAVIVAAQIGDDLAVLTLLDSPTDGLISKDRVDLATRVLEAFIGSEGVSMIVSR